MNQLFPASRAGCGIFRYWAPVLYPCARGTLRNICCYKICGTALAVKDIRWDDWTILFALVSLITQPLSCRMLIKWKNDTIIGCVLDDVEIHYGFGRQEHCLEDDWQLLEFKKYVYGESIQTFASLKWTKVSICLFLLRIPIKKIIIRPLQASVFILTVSDIILTLLWILQCRPVDAVRNKDVQGQCFSLGQLPRVIMAQVGRLFLLLSSRDYIWIYGPISSHLSSFGLCIRELSYPVR